MGKITSCWTLSNRLHDLAVTYDFAGPVFPHRQNTPLQRTTTDPLSPVGGRRTWSSTGQSSGSMFVCNLCLSAGSPMLPYRPSQGRSARHVRPMILNRTIAGTNRNPFSQSDSTPVFPVILIGKRLSEESPHDS